MTTQPAGEHHTGTLNLAGEGNAPSSPISDAAADAAARVFYGRAYGSVGDEANKVLLDGAREALEAAYPAIRLQVAEEIAAKAESIADEYEASADDHRDKSDSATPQGQRHGRASLTLRDKADAARLVAHAAREIGAH